MAGGEGDKPGRRRRRRLADLWPQWLVDGTWLGPSGARSSRYGMGVSFRCPRHRRPEDRVELWFINPLDRGPPKPSVKLYYARGATLEDLTLTAGLILVTPGGMAEKAEGACGWSGYVFDGFVIDAE